MAKGLGIAALVAAILSLVVPIVSLYVVWLALALAAVAAVFGDKTFVIAAVTICVVNVVFLSPMTWMILKGEELAGGYAFRGLTVGLFLAPVAGGLLFWKKTKRAGPPVGGGAP